MAGSGPGVADGGMPMDAGTLLMLADAVLAAHAALALFLTFGLAAILIGGPQWGLFGRSLGGWKWVRNRAFRLTHLVGLVIVAAESVVGVTCPLTDLESALRRAADGGGQGGYQSGYQSGFIAHWLGRLLFYDFDERVFLAAYVLALAVTVWAWGKWRKE